MDQYFEVDDDKEDRMNLSIGARKLATMVFAERNKKK